MEAQLLVKQMQNRVVRELRWAADTIEKWDLPDGYEGKPGMSFFGLADHVRSISERAKALNHTCAAVVAERGALKDPANPPAGGVVVPDGAISGA